MPLDDEEIAGFRRSVLVHRLADGRGCCQLLAHDDTAAAMLLERLGPNLDELRLPLPHAAGDGGDDAAVVLAADR